MFECSYIMNFMVFQADFNIYHCIIASTTWYRGGFTANDIFFYPQFSLNPKSLLHIDISQYNK